MAFYETFIWIENDGIFQAVIQKRSRIYIWCESIISFFGVFEVGYCCLEVCCMKKNIRKSVKNKEKYQF